MKILKSEKKLCISCMQEHLVNIIETEENGTFNGITVNFNAMYEYCSNTDEYLENEEMIRANSLAVKDAYRQASGLLTSVEIKRIREKYKVSQKEFSDILGWGKATIIRYENHQVQDQAHDDILRKIDSDPQWFLQMLNRAKGAISERAYKKYYTAAYEQYKKMNGRNFYKAMHIKTVINIEVAPPIKICVETCSRNPYGNGSFISSLLKYSTDNRVEPLLSV